jgi:hypothetical protein
MIRVLFGAGTAAAANGITADVDVSLDAAGAGSAGDDFTVTANVDAGSVTGEAFNMGLEESVALGVTAGEVSAGAVLSGFDDTISLILNAGGAPAIGVNKNISVLWVPGEVDDGSLTLPAIGDAFEGGFYAGLISHTADGVPTHALIVAPRATGATGTDYTITTNRQWKSFRNATAGTTSPFDGAANTAAMVTAGISSHPAANFCVGLSIGGFSDWYLPARFELDIAYFNLKPSTATNSTSWGINDYSVPKRTVNYTTSAPAMTSVAAFNSTGSERFAATSHWSSTEDTSANGWLFGFNNGSQISFPKDSFDRCRAFRRIAL